MEKNKVIDMINTLNNEANKLDLLTETLDYHLYNNNFNQAKDFIEIVEDYSIRVKKLSNELYKECKTWTK